MSPVSPAQPGVGLCAQCMHADVVPSSRGSVFYLCRLSQTDPRFPRYPRLPVVSCIGYDAIDPRRNGGQEKGPGSLKD